MDYVSDLGSIELGTFFIGTKVPPLTSSVTIATGQGVLTRGALLGKVTADGKYKLVDAAAVDGSEKALFVLAEESVDTTSADVKVVVYKQGMFNADALQVAAGDTVVAHEEELRLVNIFFKSEF